MCGTGLQQKEGVPALTTYIGSMLVIIIIIISSSSSSSSCGMAKAGRLET
jgi:hypothetical protein